MIQEDRPWEVLYSSWLQDDSELHLYKYQNSNIENQTLFPQNSEQSARRRGRPAETSENYRNSHSGVQSSSTSPEGSPESVVVRDSVPSFYSHSCHPFVFVSSFLIKHIKSQIARSAASTAAPVPLTENRSCRIQLPLIIPLHCSPFTHFPPPPRTRSARVRPSQGVPLDLLETQPTLSTLQRLCNRSCTITIRS